MKNTTLDISNACTNYFDDRAIIMSLFSKMVAPEPAQNLMIVLNIYHSANVTKKVRIRLSLWDLQLFKVAHP